MLNTGQRKRQRTKKGVCSGESNTPFIRVHFGMLYLACEMHPFFSVHPIDTKIRGPPCVLHFKKLRNGGHIDVRMD